MGRTGLSVYVIASFQKKIARLVGRLVSGPRLLGQIGPGVQVTASLKKIAFLVGRLVSGPRLLGRIGPGVQVTASFQKKNSPPSESVRSQNDRLCLCVAKTRTFLRW